MLNFFRKKRDIGKTESPDKIQSTTPCADFVAGEVRMSYKLSNIQGIGSRARQEDSFCYVNAFDVSSILERGLLAVVADGMGGGRDGKLASETAVSEIRSEFSLFQYEDGDFAPQLNAALKRASSTVYSAVRGEGGSTAIVALLYDEKLWFSSVGDSFVYLFRNHQLSRLNREQNILNEEYLKLIDAGIFEPERARDRRDRAAITSFLGIEELSDIDFTRKPLPLMAGDILMLASDGVGGVLDETELIECMELGDPALVSKAVESGIINKGLVYQDNYTALIIECLY